MPLENLFVLVPIVGAFTAFAIALAYGEYQTRNFKRDVEAPAVVAERPQEWLKAA